MIITSTVLSQITVLLPITVCWVIGFSGLGGLGFGLVLSKSFGTILPHFRWQGLSSESLVYLVWVPSGLYVSSSGNVSRDLCFYVPIVHVFMALFVQLVPFGQLGENFWGLGHAVKHVKIQILL